MSIYIYSRLVQFAFYCSNFEKTLDIGPSFTQIPVGSCINWWGASYPAVLAVLLIVNMPNLLAWWALSNQPLELLAFLVNGRVTMISKVEHSFLDQVSMWLIIAKSLHYVLVDTLWDLRIYNFSRFMGILRVLVCILWCFST